MAYLVIDLEATAWENIPSEEQKSRSEIIEIGAVLLDDSLKSMGNYQTFIFPDANPVLSDFCKKLTTISQTQVTVAPKFPDGLSKFISWCERQSGKKIKDLVFCSWGDYDKNQFMRDCTKHNVVYPFGAHRNIKKEFAEFYKIAECEIHKALLKLDMDFIGTHHRGIDDARNIARIMVKFIKISA